MEHDIYECFDAFLQKTVIEKTGMFFTNDYPTQNQEIFTSDNLENLVNLYVKNPIDKQKSNEIFDPKKDNPSFEDKVKEQLKNTSDVVKRVFGHLMWLQYLPASKPAIKSDYGKSKCEQIEKITGLKVSYCLDGVAVY